jgi:hypothetical protein
VAFVDPSGLVSVGLKAYSETYKGSTISVGPKNTLTISWNNLSFDFKVTEDNYNQDFKDWYIDDSLFVNAFGVGNQKLLVYQDAMTRNVSIRANFNITGNAADSSIEGSTYRALFLQGIEENWSGDGVSAYARESSKGVKVKIVDGAGTSNVRYGLFGWSPSNPGKMTIYTGFTDGTARTAQQFKYTAAHEFGHILGLGDAYESVAGINSTVSNDMMRWAESGRNTIYKISSANIQGALKAYNTKKFQKAWW